MSQLTFRTLCERLKEKPTAESNAEKLNIFIGAAAALTGEPAVAGAALLIKTLAEKEKLISLGAIALDAVLEKKPSDYSERVDQMKEAYGIIHFTAFFDELDSRLPAGIRKSINLSQREKQSLFDPSVTFLEAGISEKQEIRFPDIVRGYKSEDKFLLMIYSLMSARLNGLVRSLSFLETASEKDIRAFEKTIEELPKAAVKRFHDQCLTLCSKFNEFYIFTQMERERARELEAEDRHQQLLSVALRVQDSAEAGLAGLKDAIADIPGQIKEGKVREIVGELVRKYREDIEQPVIETKSGEEKLTYPLIREAFIPQSYKLLRYSGEERLAQEKTWKELEPQPGRNTAWTPAAWRTCC